MTEDDRAGGGLQVTPEQTGLLQEFFPAGAASHQFVRQVWVAGPRTRPAPLYPMQGEKNLQPFTEDLRDLSCPDL